MVQWRRAICILTIIVICCILHCKSEKCDNVFENLTAMVVDDRYNFKEVFLEGGTDDLKDAVILQIVGQKIPKLCKFEGLPKLTMIRLQDCEIGEIEKGAFGNAPSLITITLTGSRLERIPADAFSDLPIRVLNLPDNHIKTIAEGAFQNLPLVEEINLSKNNLSKFNPDWFKNTPGLRRINLVYNSIEVIPEGVFAGARGSDNASFDLWFMNNNIRSVHGDAFSGVKYIGDLWLDNNNLTGIDGGVFRNVWKIRTLSLVNNRLTCLSDEFFGPRLKMDVLMISGNPWSCECLSKILGWVERNNVACEVPKRISGCSLNKTEAT